MSALAEVPAACGHSGTKLGVKLNDKDHTVAAPDPGKALVYFAHDAGTMGFVMAYPTVRVAIDGAWVGANHGDTWFAVPVQPGVRHICVNLQTALVDDRIELAHFTAEAGKVYFYRTRLVMSGAVELLDLNPIDSDEGRYLVESSPKSVLPERK